MRKYFSVTPQTFPCILYNVQNHCSIDLFCQMFKKMLKFCVTAFTLQIILIFINTEKKMEGVYTNARKQLLISSVPAILILHLKRFHQVKGQNPLVYSSAPLVDKQLFKCHAYQYLLFKWRTGRTTI